MLDVKLGEADFVPLATCGLADVSRPLLGVSLISGLLLIVLDEFSASVDCTVAPLTLGWAHQRHAGAESFLRNTNTPSTRATACDRGGINLRMQPPVQLLFQSHLNTLVMLGRDDSLVKLEEGGNRRLRNH
jgi:hypothetical protein